jgi:hypothetical protein
MFPQKADGLYGDYILERPTVSTVLSFVGKCFHVLVTPGLTTVVQDPSPSCTGC